MQSVNATSETWYEQAAWPAFILSPAVCILGIVFSCVIRKHFESKEYKLQNRLFKDWTTSSQMTFKEFYRDDALRTPLQIAIQVNNLPLVEYLLTRPDLLKKTSDYDGNTALHYAAAFADLKTLQLVVANTSGPLPVSNFDQTPLDIAARRKNNPEIFKYLLEKYPFKRRWDPVLEV